MAPRDLHGVASRRARARDAQFHFRRATIWSQPAQRLASRGLTSRAFVQKGKLQPEIEAIEAHGHRRNMRAARPQWTSCAAAFSAGRRSPNVSQTIGGRAVHFRLRGQAQGRGVVAPNLLANIAQIGTRFDIRLTDICFNPLPISMPSASTGACCLAS